MTSGQTGGGQAGGGQAAGGFEGARQQRNALERLAARIPGYSGFADRELRREVDKLQRERLAAQVREVKNRLRETAREHTDAGQIGLPDRFGRLDRRLDKLAESIRFTDYGASGLFDAVKIGEPALERLYAFDLVLLDEVAELDRAAAAVPGPGADAETALDALFDRLRTVEARWEQRPGVISDVVAGQAAAGEG